MGYAKWISAAVALVALSFSAGNVHAQATAYNSGPPKVDPASKPTPHDAQGHPDLTGYWVGGVAGISGAPAGEQLTTRGADGSTFFDYGGAGPQGGSKPTTGRAKETPNQPTYKPEYLAKAQEIAKTMYGGSTNLDPYMECKPLGVPRAITERPIMEIAQTSSVIIVAHEAAPGPVYRVFYMNQEHPKDIDTSYMGNSVAHWEGDTLVVDTIGLNDETWLGDTRGHTLTTIHSDQEHVVERWTRTGDVITYQATVDDPVMFTKPWILKPQRIAAGVQGDYIQPSTCIPLDKGHLIEESAADKFECNFCQKSVDTTYGDGASKDQKNAQ